jgi:hypothetical protein
VFESTKFQHFYDAAPQEFRDRIDEEREAAEERIAANDGLWQKRQADIQTENDLAARIVDLERAKAAGSWGERDEKLLERTRAKHDAMRAKRQRPKAEPKPKRSARERSLTFLRSELIPDFESWFGRVSPLARFAYAPADPAGETLESVAAKQDDVLEAILDVDRAPVPFEEAVTAVDRELDRRAMDGEPNLSRLMKGDRLELPEDVVFSKDLNRSLTLERGASFAVWLHRDAIRKRLLAGLKEKYEGVEGISARDRKHRRAALEAEFLRLQRIESRLCREAADLGEPVTFRKLHPLAWYELVRVEDAEPQRAEFAGGMPMPGGAPTLGARFKAAKAEE